MVNESRLHERRSMRYDHEFNKCFEATGQMSAMSSLQICPSLNFVPVLSMMPLLTDGGWLGASMLVVRALLEC